ncbi:MAG: hypothetical protein GX066_07180 [Clostridiaceae bacterium]|nr:hypothetical protein [Clostridiaceae bacterium]
MGLFNSKMKIQSFEKDSTKYFTIVYPRKFLEYVPSGARILSNISREHNVIIHVDTSLCFYNQKDIYKKINAFRNTLSATGIPFEYRTFEGEDPNKSILSLFIQTKKKTRTFEIMTFPLKKGEAYPDLIQQLMVIGCQVFVPVDQKNYSELVPQVFSGGFKEDEHMYSTFKCILYMNDLVSQAVARTRLLVKEDIEKMVF